MGVEIVQFADPLNPLGWVAEPARRRAALAYPDAAWTVRPVGMVESWDDYDGTEVEGGRAAMAATCARLAEQHGMPIDEYLWFDDSPATSWPACRAIAAAGLQDDPSDGDGGAPDGSLDGSAPGLASRLLRACREATFARRRSIADDAVLEGLVASVPDLDAGAVAAAMDDGRAEEAFDAARRAARDLDAPGVERAGDRCVLPTLVVRADGDARGVSGVTDFGDVREAVAAVAGLDPVSDAPDARSVLERFSPEGWVARAELEHLTGSPPAVVEERVGAMVESGTVVAETAAAEPFWRLAAFVPWAGGDPASDDDGAAEPGDSAADSS